MERQSISIRERTIRTGEDANHNTRGNAYVMSRVQAMRAITFRRSAPIVLALSVSVCSCTPNGRINVPTESSADAVLSVEGASVSSVVVLSEGQRIAAGDANGNISLWSTGTWNLIDKFPAHSREITALAVSPDGTVLATGATDDMAPLKLWDVRARPRLLCQPVAKSVVWSIAFTPDGESVAAASSDGSIGVWRTRDGGRLQVFQTNLEPPLRIGVSPDARILAVSGGRPPARGGLDEVQIWDLLMGRLDCTLETERAKCIAFAPGGHRLATAALGAIDLWDSRTWKMESRLPSADGRLDVSCLAYGPRGGVIAAGMSWGSHLPGALVIWDGAARNPPRIMWAHAGGVRGVSFSPKGDFVATGGDDGTVRIWNLR
jgi:hypothetical protein